MTDFTEHVKSLQGRDRVKLMAEANDFITERGLNAEFFLFPFTSDGLPSVISFIVRTGRLNEFLEWRK